ncbi:DEAD/DEAH box helicase, partial [Ancylostoma duodenale]
GSGKTLAYAIPMVARLLELPPHSNSTGPKALILAPTRELVVQVMKHVTALLKHTSFKAFPIVGGLAQVRQARILKEQKPEVVVATPGRLWAMMKEEEEGGGPACQYLSDWSGLLCLVVDETDRMVEKGHFEEMQDILQFVCYREIANVGILSDADICSSGADAARTCQQEGADASAENK